VSSGRRPRRSTRRQLPPLSSKQACLELPGGEFRRLASFITNDNINVANAGTLKARQSALAELCNGNSSAAITLRKLVAEAQGVDNSLEFTAQYVTNLLATNVGACGEALCIKRHESISQPWSIFMNKIASAKLSCKSFRISRETNKKL